MKKTPPLWAAEPLEKMWLIILRLRQFRLSHRYR